MEDNKTLVEQLREIVEESRKGGAFPTWYAGGSITNYHYDSAIEYERELFTEIADRIEREYIPLPRFEDGETVKVGDLVMLDNEKTRRVEDIKVKVYLEGSYVTFDSVLNRPEQDTLERIEDDARKMFNDYWGCSDADCRCCPAMVGGKKPYERYGTGSCSFAQKLDLLRRQREVLERGHE